LGELIQCPPDACLYLRGLLLREWRETEKGEENVGLKGKEMDEVEGGI